MRKCETPYCKNTTKRKICDKCYSRLHRERYPMKNAYWNLKSNAKRRGKIFELTFEEFQQFCYETDYLQGRGKKKTSYSIDRIDNNKGYILSNIRVMTLSDNARKGKKHLDYDWQTGNARVVETTYRKIEVDDDLPF